MTKFYDELNGNIESHEFDGERYINLSTTIHDIENSLKRTKDELSADQIEVIKEFIDYLELCL